MEVQENLQVHIPRLASLAEFRYQLRSFLSFSEVATERAGVQAQHYQLMQVIAALPESEVASISYIAERMILRHNSTVELVDRAEKAGLVRRQSDERDLRRSLVVLTPQGARVPLMRRAFAEAAQDEFVGTDEASLLERAGVPVHVVPGSGRNLKVTQPGDLEIAEFYLAG